MKAGLGAVLACAACVSAAAECPTRADVADGGVIVSFADGSEVAYSRSRSAPGRILEVNRSVSGDDGFWVESWRGVYPVADGLLRGGAPDRSYYAKSVYPVELADLPPAAPGSSWSGKIAEVDSLGAALGETDLTVTFEGRRTLRIGACAYDAIQVETLYADDEGGFQATLDYLPELGFAVQTAGGELGSLLDFYHPVSIREAASPS
ncbi:MAG: hypothetical protein AAFP78_02440 [Pseudomonadota bacterium]